MQILIKILIWSSSEVSIFCWITIFNKPVFLQGIKNFFQIGHNEVFFTSGSLTAFVQQRFWQLMRKPDTDWTMRIKTKVEDDWLIRVLGTTAARGA